MMEVHILTMPNKATGLSPAQHMALSSLITCSHATFQPPGSSHPPTQGQHPPVGGRGWGQGCGLPLPALPVTHFSKYHPGRWLV